MMLCIHTFLLYLRRLCSLYSAVHTNSDELVWFFWQQEASDDECDLKV